MNVVVLGGGLAGMTASLELLRRGCNVQLIEAGPNLGGRTSSWTVDGHIVDTGLHVVADHYVNLIDLLTSIGAEGRLHWWHEHLYLGPGREPLLMRLEPRVVPLHLSYAARRIPLSIPEKYRLLIAGLDAGSRSQADLASLDDISYLDWHRRHHLGDGFVLELAHVVADAAAFLLPEEASARAALSWLKYLSRDGNSARLATWRTSMAEDLVAPLRCAIETLGGRIDTRTAVVGLEVDGGQVRGVRIAPSAETGPYHRASGAVSVNGPTTLLPCDTVVAALPVQAMQNILTATQARAAGLEHALKLGTVPATAVTLTFDRNIRPIPTGAPLVAGGSIRNFIDTSGHGDHGDHGDRSTYQFLVSRSICGEAMDDAALTARIAADLAAIWPAARGVRVEWASVYRVEAALFAAHPGAHQRRPRTKTDLRGLVLAGDWVRHDLNASMEGAVLSGRLAAREVLGPMRGAEVPLGVVREPMATDLLQTLVRPIRTFAAR
jgi:zeta-carotene desaturase